MTATISDTDFETRHTCIPVPARAYQLTDLITSKPQFPQLLSEASNVRVKVEVVVALGTLAGACKVHSQRCLFLSLLSPGLHLSLLLPPLLL